MLALRAKAEAGWVLAHPAVLSGFLFFRYLNKGTKKPAFYAGFRITSELTG
uniref:Uncharacterized protein n=1 Tax=Candidatus Kentrum sp. LFY TaxID=2126342 RepID=A0A450UED3_9GAMM|nr:MAG: hypothetical protein BECKLFY1418B_GA0070995_102140 [Candidatus Kentron sp. LFY]VFJ96806.1 MAG: hypothetical protein BECKLFY1418A_GA0070994_106317 [Candidatus Kentron sp. LFY]